MYVQWKGQKATNPWKVGTSPGDILRPGVSDQIDAMNPAKGIQDTINMYEQGSYNWDPVTMGTPERLMAQNFDLMKSRALGQVGAGVQSGTKTAMTSLAGSGGLSAADRAALQAQGQRQRVNLGQGSLVGYGQMQAQNMYDTSKFNIGQEQQAMDLNQQIMTGRARDIAMQGEQRAVNIYQQRLKEALLERQLDAARTIAQQQGA